MPTALIVSDPAVLGGKPTIRGTRISVELILQKLAAGQTIDDILADYPHLTREGVVAALEFAAESMHYARLYPLPQDHAPA